MNKFGFLLLAALASKGALASEVGASFPQLANSTAVLAVAIAETGTGSSLAIKPENAAEIAAQHATIDSYINDAFTEISEEFEARVLDKLEQRITVR